MKQKLTNQKYALAVWHSENKGKTESVRQFAIELLRAYPGFTPIIPIPSVIPAVNDFRLIVGINSKIVGIESLGDPKTELRRRLEELAITHNCDLIICTCRTRGETVAAVNNLRSHGYEIIWTSTYDLNGSAQQTTANATKGRHILNLVQSLTII